VLGAGFALTDDRGRSVTDETYRGKWMLVFFGYTGCREACPIGLDTLSRTLDVLGADAEKVQPLFIDFSLDAPDQATLAQFVSNFHPSIIGLTGTREQTIAAVRQYKVRREYKFGNYSRKETGMRIDHTTVVYLVDPEGKHRAYFRHDMKPEEMAKAIRNHL
jgi:protein SCO1/2